MKARHLALAMLTAAAAGVISVAWAETRLALVTEREAALPSPRTAELSYRGITRGPEITLVSPPSDEATVTSPVHLRLKFEGHGGATIHASGVKIVYVKNPEVDLTERVKPYIQSGGINIAEADVPPGNHTFRVDVTDSDGRVTTTSFSLIVKNHN